MSSPVTTVTVDTPVSRLVGLMTDLGLRHLPVVDDDGVVGMISLRLVAAAMQSAVPNLAS